MSLLSGKTALIFGLANDHSIAWGIAQAFKRAGATLGFSYAGEVLEKRVRNLAQVAQVDFVEACDVGNDADIAAMVEKAQAAFGGIDILVHSIGFAKREELNGPYYATSRAGFQTALDISVYSFTALTRAFLPIMRPNGSLLTLSYLGAERAIPNYNVMGVAKAALEASVRYLAVDLGAHEKSLRVNCISAGPIRTLAAGGVAGFRGLYGQFKNIAPLRRHVTIDDVGNAALYLCSDLAHGVTGEIHYVDAGFNIVGVPAPEPSGE